MKAGNLEVAQVFELVADLLEVRGGEDAPKAGAYRRAARSVGGCPEDVEVLHRENRLTDLPGVGQALAKKIAELVETGRLGYYERLAAEVPAGVLEMLRVPGIGVKTAGLLWRELGLDSVDRLEEALRAGALRRLPGFGPKKEEALVEGLAAFRRRSARFPLGKARPAGEALAEAVRELPGVAEAAVAGSVRRWRDTVGDLNLVAATTDPGRTLEALAGLPGLQAVSITAGAENSGSRGPKLPLDVEAVLQIGLRLRLRLVEPDHFWGALLYFTGSADHNRLVAARAKTLGFDFDERGLARDGRALPLPSEEDLYRRLGLTFIPPELREGTDEVEAAAAGAPPRLVELGDVRGDLHVHSAWSDGQASLPELAAAGQRLGYEYVAVSDHTKSLAVTGGLDEKRVLDQKEEIEALSADFAGFRLLSGVEVEIHSDGELDLPDPVLGELDVVTASIHTGLRQPAERITARLLAALKNEHVDVIGHPSGRLLGEREASSLDLDAVLEEAARRGTFLEINASPDRLDLRDTDARRARERGCLVSVGTDAHSLRGLGDMAYGVATARRAGLGPEAVVNTRPWSELRKLLGR